jgi:hypothetical protein
VRFADRPRRAGKTGAAGDNPRVRAAVTTFVDALRACLAVALFALALCACRDEAGEIEIPPLKPPYDGSVPDATIAPDGALPCADNQDCDDGVECTRDLCVHETYCVNVTDNTRCSDGVFCDGVEVCDHVQGCLPGRPMRCDDDSVCTLDSCSEEEKRCLHEVRDFDGDGEIDWHCLGGTDCDDFDATRATSAFEICADGLDNDCDDRIDETDDCSVPRHDTCEDAIEIGAGGTYVVDLAGTTANYALRCGIADARDAAFTFELTEPQDVSLLVRGLLSDGREESAAVAVRRDCDDVATEIECSQSFPALGRIRALPKGRYYAIVSSQRSAQAVLEATFSPPTKAPKNTSCKAPMDVSAGGRYSGDFVDVGDDETVECGFAPANDLVYGFTLDRARDVELSAISATGERMNFAVRTDCDDPDTTLRCVSDAPARAHMYGVPPGTYYVVLESSPAREIDFDLDVSFEAPSTPEPGDGCTQPIDLPLDEEVEGTLANRQDLVPVICRCDPDTAGDQGCNEFRHDVTYRVKVDKAKDLGLTVQSGSSSMAFDFRTACDDNDSQLACQEGVLAGARIRDVKAGTYYLVIESPDATNFTVELDSLERTQPIAVAGNDTCSKAFEIPAKGGLFRGDTFSMQDEYHALCGGNAMGKDAVYHLSLAERSRVSASIESAYDNVLYRFVDVDGAASCKSMNEAACDDDGGEVDKNSRLLEVLDPGDYYYVVDGLDQVDAGEYLFDVVIAPP